MLLPGEGWLDGSFTLSPVGRGVCGEVSGTERSGLVLPAPGPGSDTQSWSLSVPLTGSPAPGRALVPAGGQPAEGCEEDAGS